MLRADWQNSVVRQRESASSSAGTNPQYWAILLQLPNLTTRAWPFTPKDALKGTRSLVDVQFRARIVLADPVSVSSAGLLATWVGYYPVPPPATPVLLGTAIPSGFDTGMTTAAIQILEAENYTPTSLPIGGGQVPIWTNTAGGPLQIKQYVNDNDNPGFLWGGVWLQVAGTVVAPTPVTVEQEFRWDYAGEESR